jgi:hypothetical protein
MSNETAFYVYRGPNTKHPHPQTAIDDETALWAARMCVGEGGVKCIVDKASAMMWSLMNRFMLHPSCAKWPTYLALMRGFSQPINPAWQGGGRLAIKYAGTDAASPERFKRRAQICSLTWEQIPKQIVQAVRDFQRGTLELPLYVLNHTRPRISNWASYPDVEKRFLDGIWIEGDWFFEDRSLRAGAVVILNEEEKD